MASGFFGGLPRFMWFVFSIIILVASVLVYFAFKMDHDIKIDSRKDSIRNAIVNLPNILYSNNNDNELQFSDQTMETKVIKTDAKKILKNLEYTNDNHKSECKNNIFSQFTAINDPMLLYVWPMPYDFTIYNDMAIVNPNLIIESNLNHYILNNAVQRYKNIIFQHKSPMFSYYILF